MTKRQTSLILLLAAAGASCLLTLGCTTPDHLVNGCKFDCELDTCRVYCPTQEQVTTKCGRDHNKMPWHQKADDGTELIGGRGADGRYVRACTFYYPTREYNFYTWLWQDEAWRDVHEGCHRKLYREHGFRADHSKCLSVGVGPDQRRMPAVK